MQATEATESVGDSGDEARERRGKIVRAGAVVLVGGIAVAVLTGQSNAHARYGAVEQARAEVHNALGRRAQTLAVARASNSAPEPGSREQVDAQKRAYDRAVEAWNAYASGFPARLWVRMAGLPAHAPTSHEVSWW